MAMSRGFSRALALGLLGLMLAGAWRVGVAPAWRAWQADREAVARHRDTLARLRGLAAAQPRYEAALAELRSESALSDALIRSPSATLAAAELQQRVKALVEAAGGSLVSAQPEQAREAGPFTRIGLGVRMIVSIAALQQVLHALETGTPLVVIDRMQVLARGARAGSRRRAPASGDLDVRLELAAFVAGEPEQGARS